MSKSAIDVCSALVHKLEANVCSILYSSETGSPTHSYVEDNDEVEDERQDERKNEMIASSDISTSSKEQIKTTMGNKIFMKNKEKMTNYTELTDRQVELLVSSTNFSAQQVREWHQSFLHDCPSGLLNSLPYILSFESSIRAGKLDRKQFVNVYRQFYPHGKAGHFCTLAFKAFDRDKNGIVDFNEFLLAIALTMSGELKDRLDLAFSMYDINGDGVLDKKELTQIIKLIYEVNGKRHKDDLAPHEKARMIIDKLDTNGDRKLSREEFVTGCLNSSELRKLLTP